MQNSLFGKNKMEIYIYIYIYSDKTFLLLSTEHFFALVA